MPQIPTVEESPWIVIKTRELGNNPCTRRNEMTKGNYKEQRKTTHLPKMVSGAAVSVLAVALRCRRIRLDAKEKQSTSVVAVLPLKKRPVKKKTRTSKMISKSSLRWSPGEKTPLSSVLTKIMCFHVSPWQQMLPFAVCLVDEKETKRLAMVGVDTGH
jgi:hypothetical protein